MRPFTNPLFTRLPSLWTKSLPTPIAKTSVLGKSTRAVMRAFQSSVALPSVMRMTTRRTPWPSGRIPAFSVSMWSLTNPSAAPVCVAQHFSRRMFRTAPSMASAVVNLARSNLVASKMALPVYAGLAPSVAA